MLRPFAAIAPVPREEDFGLDLIGTLIRHEGSVLIAEDSFGVQIKTHTAARFTVKGEGVRWLRELKLPYFPVVVNLDRGRVSLFTLNTWQWVIQVAAVRQYTFVLDEDLENDPGDEFFPLGEPLMEWSLSDCAHDQFPAWAYSVLKPMIRIEYLVQHYGALWRFPRLKEQSTFKFKNRDSDGKAIDPPQIATIFDIPPGDTKPIREALERVIGPFARSLSNDLRDDRGKDLLQLRDSFRQLGFDPDPANEWDEIATEMSQVCRQ
jgi:hypothetical protein